jgi:hypothetical protein
MRVLTLCLAIGIMLTAACSSGSDSGGTGGTTALGGSTGSSIPLTGACASLTCLNPMMNLMAGCTLTGSCTEQVSTTTGAVNICYDNGVKMQGTMDATTLTSMDITVKNGSGVCYTMVVGGLSATSTAMTMAIKNPAGTTVGTIGIDSTAGTESVTCPGGAATVIDASCGSGGTDVTSSSSAASSSSCTQGTCTY